MRCKLIFLSTLFFSVSLWASSPSDDLSIDLNPEYKNIRTYVEEIPKSSEHDLDSLANNLIKDKKNDSEKAYAIYYWLTNNIKYDVLGLKSGNLGDLSPVGVLKSRLTVCSGYSRLFVALGKRAGLDVKEIVGDAKGYGGLGGGGHAWNAVKINGEWKLLDATWGAGSLVNDKFKRIQKDYYFFTDPKKFIYAHFPDDSKWQLLAKPITKAEFVNSVELKPSFFLYKLNLDSHTESTISTNKELEITLEAPADIIFSTTIVDSLSNKLKEYTFTQRSGNKQHFYITLPKNGRYRFNIFARNIAEIGSSYAQVLTYYIEANNWTGKLKKYPDDTITFGESKAFLFKPFMFNLEKGKEYEFEIMVPDVASVAVVEKRGIDKPKFHFLTKSGNFFSGKVSASFGSSLSIAAKLDSKKGSFSGLLRYKVE